MDKQPDRYERIPHTKFCDLDRQGKLQYIRDYYTLHIAVGVLVLGIIIWAVVYYGFTRQVPALYILGVDTAVAQEETLQQDVSAHLALGKRQSVVWDSVAVSGESEYTGFMKITTLVGANVVDVLLCTENSLEILSNMGALADLHQVLDSSLYQALEEQGLICMGTLPREDGGGAYAMAVALSDCSAADAYGLTPLNARQLYLCLSIVPEHPENAQAFLRFLLSPELG